MARQVKKVATPSKKMLAAKARRKAKGKKSVYDSEKMNLADAISVLRVRGTAHLVTFKQTETRVSLGGRSCTAEHDL